MQKAWLTDQKARLTRQVSARLEPGESVEALLVAGQVCKWGLWAIKEYQVVVTDRRVVLVEKEPGSITTETGLAGVLLTAIDLAVKAVNKPVLTDFPRRAVTTVTFKRRPMLSSLALGLPGGVLSLKVVRTHRDDAEAVARLLEAEERR